MDFPFDTSCPSDRYTYPTNHGSNASLNVSSYSQYPLPTNDPDNIPGYSDGYYPAPVSCADDVQWTAPLQGGYLSQSTEQFSSTTTYGANPTPSLSMDYPPYGLPSTLFGESFRPNHAEFRPVLNTPQVVEGSYNQPNRVPLPVGGDIHVSYTHFEAPSMVGYPATSFSLFEEAAPTSYWPSSTGFNNQPLPYLPANHSPVRSQESVEASTIPTVTVSTSPEYFVSHGRQDSNESLVRGTSLNTDYAPKYRFQDAVGRPSYKPVTQPFKCSERRFRSQISRSAKRQAVPIVPSYLGSSRLAAPTRPSPRACSKPYDPFSARTKAVKNDSIGVARTSGHTSSVSSPSLSATSSIFSRHPSPSSVTSLESRTYSPSERSPTAPEDLEKLIRNRGRLTRLLTKHFEQPIEAFKVHKKQFPRQKNAELLCQWMSPLGMLCSNRKFDDPGEVIRMLGRQKGFSSEDEPTVLRHEGHHRKEETDHLIGVGAHNFPPELRTKWNDSAIDAQLELDRSSQADSV